MKTFQAFVRAWSRDGTSVYYEPFMVWASKFHVAASRAAAQATSAGKAPKQLARLEVRVEEIRK